MREKSLRTEGNQGQTIFAHMSLRRHDHHLVKKAIDGWPKRSHAFQGLSIFLPGTQCLHFGRNSCRFGVQALLSRLDEILTRDGIAILFYFCLAKDVLDPLECGGNGQQIV